VGSAVAGGAPGEGGVDSRGRVLMEAMRDFTLFAWSAWYVTGIAFGGAGA
jgi:hypothetical protein